MALAKCILTETDGTTKHNYTPLNAVVKFEGNKRPDTLTTMFPMQNKAKENYEIVYIQDVVDVEYLRAVYPMQLSCLDESGTDTDPSSDPVETRFSNVTTNKFKGHYALNFTADGQGVVYTDPRVANGGAIDISGQFDINIWFTPDQTQLQDGTDEPLLWSFRGSSNNRGLEIGITGTNGVPSGWRVFLRVNNGSTTTGYTGSNEVVLNGTDQPVHIRVKRGQDNLLKAYVNGIEDISETVTQDIQPTVATNMVFGDSPTSTNDEYSGLIHEIKVYCGTDLTESQAEKIRWIKPIAQYMKFAGRIVKIKNEQTTKKVICQSNSYRFTKGKLGQDGSSLTSHDLTVVAFKTILQSAVDEIDSDFTVRNLDSFAETTQISFVLAGDIFEIGGFMQFTSILLLYSDTTMYMTPRKNIIIETNAGKDTDYVFDQNGTNVKYYIKNSEDNDFKLINEVILTGKSPATNQRSNFTPTSGIIRSLRRNVLQIDTSNDLKELADRTRVDLQGDVTNDLAPTKYRIEVNVPISHIRYNMNVQIKRKNGENVSVGVTDNDLDEQAVIKQIESYYPNGSTIIKVGENDIDDFDDVVESTRVEDGLLDNTI